MKRRISGLTLVPLLAALVLSGCVINQDRIATEVDHGAHAGHGNQTDLSGEFSASDIMFAQMMIPHHEQALEMSGLAIRSSSDAELLALAEQIKAAQAPEIAQMKSWLTAVGAPFDMGHDMHDMGMDGMLTDAEMAELANAKGSDFDRLFLKGMIAHHEGAILMAQMVARSTNDEVRALADAIIREQKREIELMRDMLQARGWSE